MFSFGLVGVWLWICLAAAVIPAIVLLIFVYRQDRIEKEPADLLLKLVGFGILSAVLAAVAETVGDLVLDMFVDYNLWIYPVLDAFIVVAIAEEGFKYLLMKTATWKNPAFNYSFDAIVYAVFTSLGFAAFENIFYVLSYGLGTAFIRAFISVPGHFAFAVVMGFFYSRAKVCEQKKDEKGCELNKLLAVVVPVLCHGFFDALLMSDNEYTGAIFLVFIIIFYVFVFRLLGLEARSDYAILSEETLYNQEAEAARVEAMRQDIFNNAAAPGDITKSSDSYNYEE